MHTRKPIYVRGNKTILDIEILGIYSTISLIEYFLKKMKEKIGTHTSIPCFIENTDK